MKLLLITIVSLISSIALSQTNILVTNPEADAILKGNFDPNTYMASNQIASKAAIVSSINNNVQPDSLKSYIFQMNDFNTRNTGSDTLSPTNGMGAARTWGYNRFLDISAQNENRLIVSYLQFDQAICGMTRHKNVFGVLPGSDTSNHQIIIIEGHLDSRCDTACDTSCVAKGMEDNASGSALVLELARVMSQFTYKNTIVFMLTTGEEQGLYGANAFSQYAVDYNLPIKAVFNNDVVGGIICGQTSSAPSCPGLNDIDSTAVRLFSQGSNSHHKQLARFTNLEYKEELLSQVNVPMTIHIMSGEDRIGRGGDHIPFRQDGFTAIRTTSANEHGDASNGAGYTDRQHTSDDILGVDTNNDQEIDSFFVDFNYLSRNSVINGVSASMVAIGPETPEYDLVSYSDSSITITITNNTQYPQYRVAIRTTQTDWDTVFTMNSLSDTFYLDSANWYFVSAASVDSAGVESLFSLEQSIYSQWLDVEDLDVDEVSSPYTLLQNHPNPFDESTFITVHVANAKEYKNAVVEVRDLTGNLVRSMPIELKSGTNDVLYEHGYGATGTYLYSLIVDGKIIDTKRMIFAN